MKQFILIKPLMSFLQSTPEREHAILRVLRGLSSVNLFIGTLLIPLFFLPFTRDILNTPKQLLLEGVVLVGLLVWLFLMTLTKHVYLRRTVLDIPILIFLGGVIVSGIFSVARTTSFFGDPGVFVWNVVTALAFILWFWLFIQHVETAKRFEYLSQTLLVSGAIAAGWFLFSSFSLLPKLPYNLSNVVSPVNSVFGMFVAILGVIALGLLLSKNRRGVALIVPGITFLVSVATLARLGFTVSWVVFAVGVGLLLIVGSTMVAEVRLWVLSVTFFLFLIVLLFIFYGTPAGIKAELPVEVALGSQPSMGILKDTVLSRPKFFLLGPGPGTFVYAFSLFRPEGLNLNELAWSIRFVQPYNSPVALITELGIVGSISFLFIVLLHLGSACSAWLKTRPSVWKKIADKTLGHQTDELQGRLADAFVFVAAWVAATVGMFLAFYDVTLWWLWWWLLAAGIIGLSQALPTFIREKYISLPLSPQYALAVSFSLILVFTTVIVFGIFNGKVYAAEMAYTRAVNAGHIDSEEAALKEALGYRSSYPLYNMRLANVYLERARVASTATSPNVDEVATFLSQAVNQARTATDVEAQRVETWETLALMYLNARAFAPEANQWAVDALRKAVELEPTNPVFYWRLGVAEEFAGNTEEAAKMYRRAKELKADYAVAYVSLSNLLEQQKKINEAVEVYGPLMPYIQNEPELLFNVARLLYNRNAKGDAEQAEQLWLQSVKVAPEYSNALYSLGLLYERRGQRQKALEYFERVSALNPNNNDVRQKIQRLR